MGVNGTEYSYGIAGFLGCDVGVGMFGEREEGFEGEAEGAEEFERAAWREEQIRRARRASQE